MSLKRAGNGSNGKGFAMAFKKENNYEIRYGVPTASGSESEKVIRVEGEYKKDSCLKKIDGLGYRLIACDKLYPFSLPKHAHDIELAYNAHANACHAMEMGDMPWDDSAFEALSEIREIREYAFGSYEPVAWVPGKIYAKLRDWTFWAQNYRGDVNNEWRRIRDAQ
jgi:hypothetical protein